MRWSEIRSAHPDQWLVIEALDARSENDHRIFDRIAVVEMCSDGRAAMKRYGELRRASHPHREFGFERGSGTEPELIVNVIYRTVSHVGSIGCEVVRPLLYRPAMKFACLAAAATALTACVADPGGSTSYPPPTTTTRLANINAWVGIDRGVLRIDSGVAGCPRIDPSLAVKVAAQTATVLNEGGAETVDTSEPGHKVVNCSAPQFQLPTDALVGRPVITIADDSATWTIELDHPGVARTLQLDTPATTYQPGDTLTLHTDLPGALEWAGLVATVNGKQLFSSTSSSRDAARFTIPAVAELTAPTTVELTVRAAIDPTVRCEGPSLCSPDRVSATPYVFTATLVP